MTTNVNVNLAQAELVAEAQRTQQANREAQVEKERQRKLDIVAGRIPNDFKEKKRAVPDYDPVDLYQYLPDSGSGYLLVPSDAEFKAKVRGMAPFSFQPYSREPEVQFICSVGAGPGGSNAGRGITSGLYASNEAGVVAPGDVMPLKMLPSYTIEAYFKLSSAVEATPPWGPSSIASCGFGDFGGLYIRRSWSYLKDYPKTRLTPFVQASWSMFPAQLGQAVFSRMFDPSESANGSEGPVGSDLIIPSIYTDEWQHMAIVKTSGESSETANYSCYLSGSRIASFLNVPIQGITTTIPGMGSTWGADHPDPGSAVPLGSYGESSLIHGLRFTSRALYTGETYTAPTSIQSLR